jgi:hypothetical protein
MIKLIFDLAVFLKVHPVLSILAALPFAAFELYLKF